MECVRLEREQLRDPATKVARMDYSSFTVFQRMMWLSEEAGSDCTGPTKSAALVVGLGRGELVLIWGA